MRERGQQPRLGQTVAMLVEIDADAVAAEINDVGRPGAIGIGEMDTALVEGLGIVEPGRVVQRHLRAEAAVPDIGPVADLAVANAHEVGQAVAGHVGEIDRLRAVGENEARTFFFVKWARYAISRPEALLGVRFVPGGEGLIFRDEHVGMAIAGEVDEAQIGILPVECWEGSGTCGIGPIRHRRCEKEPRSRRAEIHEVEIAVSGEIQKLLTPAVQRSERRTRRHAFDGPEAPFAEVLLVKPGVGFFGKHAGDAFAVEVDPAVAVAVDAGRKIFKAGGVDFLKRKLVERQIVERADRIFEFELRQGTFEVGRIRRGNPFEARLHNLRNEGSVGLFRVGEFGRPYKIVVDAQFAGKMMEDQNATAQAVAADFKAGSIGRERILADGPLSVRRQIQHGRREDPFIRVLCFLVMTLAVVEYQLEHPICRAEIRLRNVRPTEAGQSRDRSGAAADFRTGCISDTGWRSAHDCAR